MAFCGAQVACGRALLLCSCPVIFHRSFVSKWIHLLCRNALETKHMAAGWAHMWQGSSQHKTFRNSVVGQYSLGRLLMRHHTRTDLFKLQQSGEQTPAGAIGSVWQVGASQLCASFL